MRSSKTESLAEVLQQYIKAFKLSAGLQEAEIQKQWHLVMGPRVSSVTTGVRYYNHVLFVYTTSPVISHELRLMKPAVLLKLSQACGVEITEAVFR